MIQQNSLGWPILENFEVSCKVFMGTSATQKSMDYFPQDYDSNIVTEGNCPHGQEAYECPSELAQNQSEQPATPFGQLFLQSFKLYKIYREPKSYSPPGQLKTLLFQLLAISVEATDFNKISSIFQWRSLEVNIKSSTACNSFH